MGGSRRKVKRRRKWNRRRKKKRKSVDSLSLLQLNPRGWLSKKAADLIEAKQPDYVNIEETQLK